MSDHREDVNIFSNKVKWEMKKRLYKKESFTCNKLKSLMEAKKIKSEDIVKIIDEK